MYKNPPKLNKYISLSISKDKSFLEILDSVEELKGDIRNNIKKDNKCKSCDKFIVKNLEEHQITCFQKKIKELENHINNLELKMKEREYEIRHEIHVKGLELLIERNNEKWNKYIKKYKK
jgi:hypothetical protein